MYSIYDTYLMRNDLDNRYTAARNVGTGAMRPQMNNSPFPAPAAPVAAPAPNQQQRSIYDSFSTTPEQQTKSIYDTMPAEQPTSLPFNQQQQSVYEGGVTGREGDTYTDAQLEGYQSPAFFDTLAGLTYGGFQTAADIALPGLGFGLGEFKNWATDPNYNWSTLGRNAAGYVGNKMIGLGVNPYIGKLTSNISNPYAKAGAGMVASKAANNFSSKMLNTFLDLILGNPSSKTTVGKFEQDPFLSVGPFQGQNYSTIGDPQQDPFLATPPAMTDTPMGTMTTDQYHAGFNEFGTYGGTIPSGNPDPSKPGMWDSGVAPSKGGDYWDYGNGATGWGDSSYGGEGY